MPRSLAPLPPPEWRRNRQVQRLTKEILALQREAAANVVTAIIAMGQRMRAIHQSLDQGQWLAWLATAVPLSQRSVYNAMRLSEWAEAEPRELARLEHLGPTKLYLLGPLPPARRRELTGRVPLVIPGHPVPPKTIDAMTVVELAKVIGGLTTRPSPRKPVGKVMQSVRYRIAAIDTLADELVQRRDEVDSEQASAMLAELRAVLAELEGAFG